MAFSQGFEFFFTPPVGERRYSPAGVHFELIYGHAAQFGEFFMGLLPGLGRNGNHDGLKQFVAVLPDGIRQFLIVK